jgi:uncharacterized membrane protein
MNNAIRFVADRFRRVTVARDPNFIFEEGLTFGQRLADRVAAIGGSWTFILGFSGLLLAYALLNSVILASRAFDPFPYIFLNLMLSMLAAVQAPIIMMSQNRQAARDRLEARLDYEVNQKAEAQIGMMMEQIIAIRASVEQLSHLLEQHPDQVQAEPIPPAPLSSARGPLP